MKVKISNCKIKSISCCKEQDIFFIFKFYGVSSFWGQLSDAALSTPQAAKISNNPRRENTPGGLYSFGSLRPLLRSASLRAKTYKKYYLNFKVLSNPLKMLNTLKLKTAPKL